jgi:hypothetical protein
LGKASEESKFKFETEIGSRFKVEVNKLRLSMAMDAFLIEFELIFPEKEEAEAGTGSAEKLETKLSVLSK